MDVFLQLAKHMANVLRSWDDIVVVGHYDADGITSTAIMVSALRRLGKSVDFVNLKQLYSDDVEKIQDLGEYLVFVDFGVGQLPFLRENLEKPFMILDHHRIPPGEDHPLLLHPSFAGMDGAREISGAGVTYAVARYLGDNADLAKLAVVGAVGDLQARDGLTGFNKVVSLADAVAAGDIFAYTDLALYGRVSRPIPYMLLFSTDPILPGLTANERGVFEFLDRAHIPYKDGDRWLHYVDLSEEEKRHLFSELAVYLMRRGWSPERVKLLMGEVYDLPKEDLYSPLREAREFATLLNACGRHGYPEIGVRVSMGDREGWYREALALLNRHREALRRGIQWVESVGVSEMEYIYYFHAGKVIPATIVGIVAGMVYGSGIVPPTKPIIAMAYEDEDYVKVSARATRRLVSRGLDLSVVMRRAAEAVGGEAGGHKPAAGARIPRGSEDEFLSVANRAVGELLGFL